MKVEIGGKRIGSESKMTTSMRQYRRSTFDLSRAVRTSTSPGPLTPVMVEPMNLGDTADIKVSSLVKTIPTVGPLFGSYKLQVDGFFIPTRLYNRALHNDKLKVGLKPGDIKFPQVRLKATPEFFPGYQDPNRRQVSPRSLMPYLGVRGIGAIDPGSSTVTRDFNAIPLLGYADIYKCYYANKQEDVGAVLVGRRSVTIPEVTKIEMRAGDTVMWRLKGGETLSPDNFPGKRQIWIYGNHLTAISSVVARTSTGGTLNLSDGMGSSYVVESVTETLIVIKNVEGQSFMESFKGCSFIGNSSETSWYSSTDDIVTFPLENIDIMRDRIFEQTDGDALTLGEDTEGPLDNLPYSAVYGLASGDQIAVSQTRYGQSGLLLKTHLSDRFNNWVSEEWVEGADGIASITAVDVSGGLLRMDALNLMQKVYNYMNRVVVAGGSYKDWLEATYGVKPAGMRETPIYIGGMSSEITFDEVISTAATEAKLEDVPLGTLAGRGQNRNFRGKTQRVKATEGPGYIMYIMSITPRVDYSQGNKYFARHKTIDDLHKPELDGIGFQDLITDEMLGSGTIVSFGVPQYESIGKQPAWIEHQTSQNEAYADFAEDGKAQFMTLQKKFWIETPGKMANASTYIDPGMYNTPFADTSREAHNFWVQLLFDFKMRRVMSSKQIPNL